MNRKIPVALTAAIAVIVLAAFQYPNLPYYNGIAKYYMEDYTAAIDIYDKILQTNQNNADALIARGDAKHKLGNTEGAIEDYSKGLNIKYKYNYIGDEMSRPEDFNVIAGIGFIGGLLIYHARKAMIENPCSINEYPNTSNTNRIDIESIGMGGAVSNFDKLLKIKPDDLDALFVRGYAKLKSRDYEEAIEDFNKILQLDPDNAATLFARAKAKQKLKDTDGAEDDYEQAINIKYFNKNITIAAAREMADDKHFYIYDAIKDFSDILDNDPDNAVALFNRGYAKYIAEHPECAIQDLNKALSIDPDYAEAIKYRGLVRNHLHHVDEAMADFNRVSTSDSDDPDVLIAVGHIKGHADDLDSAVEYYNKGLNMKYFNRNLISPEAKKKAKENYFYYLYFAEKDFSGLLDITPNDANALFNRGYATWITSSEFKALEDLDKAISIDPNYADAYIIRGKIKSEELDDHEGGTKDYNKGMELKEAGY